MSHPFDRDGWAAWHKRAVKVKAEGGDAYLTVLCEHGRVPHDPTEIPNRFNCSVCVMTTAEKAALVSDGMEFPVDNLIPTDADGKRYD